MEPKIEKWETTEVLWRLYGSKKGFVEYMKTLGIKMSLSQFNKLLGVRKPLEKSEYALVFRKFSHPDSREGREFREHVLDAYYMGKYLMEAGVFGYEESRDVSAVTPQEARQLERKFEGKAVTKLVVPEEIVEEAVEEAVEETTSAATNELDDFLNDTDNCAPHDALTNERVLEMRKIEATSVRDGCECEVEEEIEEESGQKIYGSFLDGILSGSSNGNARRGGGHEPPPMRDNGIRGDGFDGDLRDVPDIYDSESHRF